MPGQCDDRELDDQLLQRVVAEYLEMPGLQLTIEQARRLWGCNADTCQRAATLLVQRGMLRWSRDGRLMRG